MATKKGPAKVKPRKTAKPAKKAAASIKHTTEPKPAKAVKAKKGAPATKPAKKVGAKPSPASPSKPTLTKPLARRKAEESGLDARRYCRVPDDWEAPDMMPIDIVNPDSGDDIAETLERDIILLDTKDRQLVWASSVLGELPRSKLERAVAPLRAAETDEATDDIDEIGTWTLRTVFDPVSKQGIVFAESLDSSDANNAVPVTGSSLAAALEDAKASLCADCGYEYGEGDEDDDDEDEDEDEDEEGGDAEGDKE